MLEDSASVRSHAGKHRSRAAKLRIRAGSFTRLSGKCRMAYAGNPLRETFPYSYHFWKRFFVYIKEGVLTQPQGKYSPWEVSLLPRPSPPRFSIGERGSSPPPPLPGHPHGGRAPRPDATRPVPFRFFRGERCAIGAFTCSFLGDNVGFLAVGVLVACTTRRVSGSWLARFGWIPASCSDVLPCYPFHCWHNLHWPSFGFLCFVPTRWNSVVNLKLFA